MRHQYQMLSLTYGIWKKGQTELLCRTDTDSQTLKNLWLPKETGWIKEGWAGGLDVNVLKLGCDDGCTAINIFKFTELLKKLKNKLKMDKIF